MKFKSKINIFALNLVLSYFCCFTVGVSADEMYIRPEDKFSNYPTYVITTYDKEEYLFHKENEPLQSAFTFNDKTGYFHRYKNDKKILCEYTWENSKDRYLSCTNIANCPHGPLKSANVHVSWILHYRKNICVEGLVPEGVVAFILDRNSGFKRNGCNYGSRYARMRLKDFEEEGREREKLRAKKSKELEERKLKIQQIRQWRQFKGMNPYGSYCLVGEDKKQFDTWLENGGYNPEICVPNPPEKSDKCQVA